MCFLCVCVCAELLESITRMVELVACFILVSCGYLVGLFTGWVDGRKSVYRKRVTEPSSKNTSTTCQTYNHLGKQALVKKLSKASLAYIPSENKYEKVYDAEIIENEIQIEKGDLKNE